MEKKNGSITVKVGSGTYIVNMMAAEDAKGTFEEKVRKVISEEIYEEE